MVLLYSSEYIECIAKKTYQILLVLYSIQINTLCRKLDLILIHTKLVHYIDIYLLKLCFLYFPESNKFGKIQ